MYLVIYIYIHLPAWWGWRPQPEPFLPGLGRGRGEGGSYAARHPLAWSELMLEGESSPLEKRPITLWLCQNSY
jgi:hypothetical protein